jgi:hypothetical protein
VLLLTWINTPSCVDDYEGFVYKITNLDSGKFYVGKKSYWRIVKRPALKGRSKAEQERRAKLKGNKRHYRVETDWIDYWGSSKELLADIELLGEERFKREILMFCSSKWEMAYYEAKFQFDLDVIFREDSYNGILNLRVPKAPKHLRK